MGWGEFSDLAVREEGMFRLRLSLVRVGADGGQMVLGSVDSGVLRVGGRKG